MRKDLETTIEEFNYAFSNQQIDKVMTFFAENAEFREMNGHNAKGKAALKLAIEKIFSGEYGKLTFSGKSVIIDNNKRAAFFAWYCQHDFTQKPNTGLRGRFMHYFMKLIYGKYTYWEGVDYFEFDKNNLITSKQTFGRASMPKLIKGRRPS